VAPQTRILNAKPSQLFPVQSLKFSEKILKTGVLKNAFDYSTNAPYFCSLKILGKNLKTIGIIQKI
jgi:hypothetical protein